MRASCSYEATGERISISKRSVVVKWEAALRRIVRRDRNSGVARAFDAETVGHSGTSVRAILYVVSGILLVWKMEVPSLTPLSNGARVGSKKSEV